MKHVSKTEFDCSKFLKHFSIGYDTLGRTDLQADRGDPLPGANNTAAVAVSFWEFSKTWDFWPQNDWSLRRRTCVPFAKDLGRMGDSNSLTPSTCVSVAPRARWCLGPTNFRSVDSEWFSSPFYNPWVTHFSPKSPKLEIGCAESYKANTHHWFKTAKLGILGPLGKCPFRSIKRRCSRCTILMSSRRICPSATPRPSMTRPWRPRVGSSKCHFCIFVFVFVFVCCCLFVCLLACLLACLLGWLVGCLFFFFFFFVFVFVVVVVVVFYGVFISLFFLKQVMFTDGHKSVFKLENLMKELVDFRLVVFRFLGLRLVAAFVQQAESHSAGDLRPPEAPALGWRSQSQQVQLQPGYQRRGNGFTVMPWSEKSLVTSLRSEHKLMS